ncbi:uncharacterized protein G2W53_032472 [Senna tora]|uniref:Uncharacterized protein n=1 Tax=Senna tora TaxID=362788 RepID=A0A834SXE3_9FABA|nr:uncharacterized protein G2W53_032472 [Senna tora]
MEDGGNEPRTAKKSRDVHAAQ